MTTATAPAAIRPNLVVEAMDPTEAETLGYDVEGVCEGVCEMDNTLEDCRTTWKRYARLYNRALADGNETDRRWYAWCVLYVEGHAARLTERTGTKADYAKIA